MTWQSWPAATLNASYITDGVVSADVQGAADHRGAPGHATVTDMTTGGGPKLQAMSGAIVREPIFAGEPITAAKIIRSGDTSYMAVRLPAGMLAMSLPINVESAAGGFIQPGDRVDVMSTHADASKNGGGMVTETVLANALVLAIDQHTEQPKAGASLIGATVTIEVPAPSASRGARPHPGRPHAGAALLRRHRRPHPGGRRRRPLRPHLQGRRRRRNGDRAMTKAALLDPCRALPAAPR